MALAKDNKDYLMDELTRRHKAPKVYQYSTVEKQKICMDDDDFFNYVKRSYSSIKARDDHLLLEHIRTMKPKVTKKQEKLMYPEKSILD